MKSLKKKIVRRRRVRRGIRKKITGTGERPRMSVFRSSKHVYAQLIDDTRGVTVASASSLEKDASGSPKEVCAIVGKRLAERASEAGVQSVVFDRNGFAYHGRIKALADGAREGGLKF